jgi:hypothetical protein
MAERDDSRTIEALWPRIPHLDIGEIYMADIGEPEKIIEIIPVKEPVKEPATPG